MRLPVTREPMFDQNPLRETLERGDSAIGAVAKVASPTLIEVYGEIGLDFAFVDLEHGGQSPFDSDYLEHLYRAAIIGEIEPLVRLPSGDPPLVRKVLDTGVRSVIVPRVKTAEEVRRTVEASRFDYDGGPGERGFVSGSQASMWGRYLDGYLDRQDDTALVGVIIETAEGLENVEEILSVPELGFAFVGHRDLTVSLGHRTDVDHPEVRAAADRVLEAARDAGVPVGRVASDPDDARAGVERGFQFFLVGYELHAVREVFGRWVSEFRDD